MLALLLQTAFVDAGELPDYQLGRGYPLGDTGLRIGGYTSVQWQVPRKGPWRFEISDLSLLLSWQAHARLRFFSELEVGDAFSAEDHGSAGGQDARFELERLYMDGLINENISLRFGKFLTPMGRWNLIHADPLVWTANRPVVTENLFSKHANGLMLHGSIPLFERTLGYAFYADLTKSLDPHLSENPFENALGAHATYALTNNVEVGGSYANAQFQGYGPTRFNLLGLEAFWQHHGFELSSEWVYRDRASEFSGRGIWQGFLQAVVPTVGHWFAVGRYEYFEQASSKAGQVGVFGMAYRPLPPLVWKLEYRVGANNQSAAPDGFYTSFAVLF